MSREWVYWNLIPSLWFLWALYWWAAARNVKAVARKESWQSRVAHSVPLIMAAALFWIPALPVPGFGARFLPLSKGAYWVGAALTAAGLLFAVWARVHIGRNWSGTITLKEGHELVTSGPYRYARHPIYTGILVAFVGSAIARGDVQGIVGVALATYALWRKIRLEEQWMGERFGAEYAAYRTRVKALVPYVL